MSSVIRIFIGHSHRPFRLSDVIRVCCAKYQRFSMSNRGEFSARCGSSGRVMKKGLICGIAAGIKPWYPVFALRRVADDRTEFGSQARLRWAKSRAAAHKLALPRLRPANFAGDSLAALVSEDDGACDKNSRRSEGVT